LGTPIQRIAAPEEVAAFVSYVASDSAGFITGKVDFFF
jgi:NAD(P)-dependent dehydrogenase (short-subunit alcohol dehydrogenase family)